MTATAFIRFGHGYETGSLGRCEAFDGFTILASPLGGFDNAARESRHFPKRDGKSGVTYSSHAIKLAKVAHSHDLYILMQHGGGREVLRVPTFYDGGDLEAAILALPERVQYALLYKIWQTAANARREAQRQTAHTYAQAFVDKRLKKKRRAGRVSVEIAPPVELTVAA